MSTDTIAKLESILNEAVSDLKRTTSKKMFGCHAVWVNDNVFALVWKTGRIGFKLPNEKVYEALMSKEGSAPWTAGPKQMAHWVLVPESYHSKRAELKKLAAKAHELCAELEPKSKKKSAPKMATKKAIKVKKGT
ncbi:MAG: TfoX/Sxy family protein [Proteobacteria bacterium]|nr:TfoX/Sxy family protein [Pseudomonadota bacterium]